MKFKQFLNKFDIAKQELAISMQRSTSKYKIKKLKQI